ncbi:MULTISPECIES: DUF2169 domain-containing protein [Methylobacterium]|uniref:DUF2169 family type VI secretion system accessory protein n=1 Tax=Methylobacterium TaxID=407 RepID=UPI00272E3A70|nr:DUF2169 domain-containing protein [Methylobacterium sp.]
MPELLNYTPFPNFRYYSSDNRGREFGVVIVKATYAIEADGRLAVAEEQAPLVFDDTCHGADNETSLRLPSDLVPHKPRTDLIVDAVARAPGGEPKRSWTCGIAVEGAAGPVLAKSLRVTGPREWRPRWRRRLSAEEARDWRAHRRLFAGWELSEPEPASEVPLRYELAYGGTVAAGEDEAGRPRFVCEVRNPIGRGLIDPDWTDHGQARPAPQIEAEGDPVTDPGRAYPPQGLGPIPPAWEPRLPLGGTYDQHWIDHVWPNWAEDYDFAFHNSAHPDLICPGYLAGGETIVLMNLMPGEAESRLVLPDHGMVAEFVRADGTAEAREMALDTVFLDLACARRSRARVFLTWRVNFEPGAFAAVRLVTRADRDAVLAARRTDGVAEETA